MGDKRRVGWEVISLGILLLMTSQHWVAKHLISSNHRSQMQTVIHQDLTASSNTGINNTGRVSLVR